MLIHLSETVGGSHFSFLFSSFLFWIDGINQKVNVELRKRGRSYTTDLSALGSPRLTADRDCGVYIDVRVEREMRFMSTVYFDIMVPFLSIRSYRDDMFFQLSVSRSAFTVQLNPVLTSPLSTCFLLSVQ